MPRDDTTAAPRDVTAVRACGAYRRRLLDHVAVVDEASVRQDLRGRETLQRSLLRSDEQHIACGHLCQTGQSSSETCKRKDSHKREILTVQPELPISLAAVDAPVITERFGAMNVIREAT